MTIFFLFFIDHNTNSSSSNFWKKNFSKWKLKWSETGKFHNDKILNETIIYKSYILSIIFKYLKRLES